MLLYSGVATGGSRGQSATPDSEKFAKNLEKSGKRGRVGKKRQKSGRFFHFAPPDRQGWLRYYVLNNDYPTYY